MKNIKNPPYKTLEEEYAALLISLLRDRMEFEKFRATLRAMHQKPKKAPSKRMNAKKRRAKVAERRSRAA